MEALETSQTTITYALYLHWDFNEITCQSEKFGAAYKPYKQMESFRQEIEVCSHYDIHTSSHKFTWSNKKHGRDFSKERIDRAMANQERKKMFLDAICNVLLEFKYDNSPHHISMLRSSIRRRRTRVIFKYETAWTLGKECSKTVETAYCKGIVGNDGASMIRNKIANCQVSSFEVKF